VSFDVCSGRFVFKQLVVWLFIVLKSSNLTTSWMEELCLNSLQEQEIFLLPTTPIRILEPKRLPRERVPEPFLRGTILASQFYIELNLKMSGTICPCPFTAL